MGLSHREWIRSMRSEFRICPGCGRSREELIRCEPDRHENEIFTIEHLIPRSMGGHNSPENIIIVCRRCNQLRGNQMPWNWFGEHNRIFTDQRVREMRAERTSRRSRKERVLERVG